MVTETEKTFQYGFILTESCLQHLIDIVGDQFRERLGDAPPKLVFTVRLRNGVTLSAYSLDRVLREENLGASQIVRLEISWFAPSALDPTFVSLVFKSANLETEENDTPIRLFVRGEPHEWVSTTASVLEQRIRAIRRFTPNQLKRRSMSRFFSLLISPLIALTFLLGIIYPLTLSFDKILWYSYTMTDIWRFGETQEGKASFISRDSLEEAKDNRVNAAISTLVSHKPFWVAVSGVLALDLVLLFFLRYYPFYNFCWGSYFRTFPQREHARAFVVVVTACTIVTSFVYSILANLTGRHT